MAYIIKEEKVFHTTHFPFHHVIVHKPEHSLYNIFAFIVEVTNLFLVQGNTIKIVIKFSKNYLQLKNAFGSIVKIVRSPKIPSNKISDVASVAPRRIFVLVIVFLPVSAFSTEENVEYRFRPLVSTVLKN